MEPTEGRVIDPNEGRGIEVIVGRARRSVVE